MKLYLIMIILSGTIMMAESWNYRVYSPLFGTLGTITIDRFEGKKDYRINIGVKTMGIAGTLTGQHREQYISKGETKGEKYLSRIFRIERWMKKKHQIDDYNIDPSHRSVTKRKLRWEKGRLDRNSSKTLPYFTREDLVALYHNRVPPLLKSPPGTRWRGYAVGAEKIKGIVTVSRADEATERKERRRLGVGREATILIVSTPEKLLGKRNRRLIMAIDPEGALLKARLVALPVVGEIFVERVKR